MEQKNNIRYIIGIDYGHGETSAHIIDLRNGKPKVLNIKNNNGAPVISAIVGTTIVNKPNINLFSKLENIADEIRRNHTAPNFVFSAYFKHPLVAGVNNGTEAISDTDRCYFSTFVKMVWESINRVNKNNYNIVLSPANFELYVGCPSAWDNNQIKAFKDFLIENGVPCTAVVKESNAVWINNRPVYFNEIIDSRPLIIDYGSSTIDYTYIPGPNCERPIDNADLGDKNPTNLLGASRVETAILEYIKEQKPDEYRELLRQFQEEAENAMKANGIVLGEQDAKKAKKNQIVLLDCILEIEVRRLKEIFYENLTENPHKRMDQLNCNNLFPNIRVDFNLPNYITNRELNIILEGYKTEVKKNMEDFKRLITNDGAKEGPTEIILTGGASKMDFVPVLIEEIFGLVPKNTGDPKIMVGEGIVEYGNLMYQSRREEKKWNQINDTWLNPVWIQDKIDGLCKDKTAEIYNNKIQEIFNGWMEGNITSVQGHNLYQYTDDIINELGKSLNEINSGLENINERSRQNPNDEALINTLDKITKESAEIAKLKTDVWDIIAQSKGFNPDNSHSIHALLRTIVDSFDNKEKNNEIKTEITAEIQIAIKDQVLNEITPLLKEYISIFFPKTENQDEIVAEVLKEISNNLNFEYTINITYELRKNLVKQIIEKSFEIINEKDMGGASTRSFNNDRYEFSAPWRSGRKNFEGFQKIIEAFSNDIAIAVTINNLNVVAINFSTAILVGVEKIKNICTRGVVGA